MSQDLSRSHRHWGLGGGGQASSPSSGANANTTRQHDPTALDSINAWLAAFDERESLCTPSACLSWTLPGQLSCFDQFRLEGLSFPIPPMIHMGKRVPCNTCLRRSHKRKERSRACIFMSSVRKMFMPSAEVILILLSFVA